MKRLVIILLFPLLGYTQTDNFKIINSNLNWSKVYSDSLKKEDIITNLRFYNSFDKFEVKENTVYFTINYSPDKLKKYGYKVSKFPTYFFNPSYCNGIIEFKDDRYRITIVEVFVNNLNFISLEPKTELVDFYIIKNDIIKRNKSNQRVLSLFDSFFSDAFKVKQKENKW